MWLGIREPPFHLDNGTFISALPQLAVSLPLSFLVGLWFKVTLLGFAWHFLSHATGEVSLSEVDGTEMGQLVPDPAEPQALVFKGLPKPACQTEPSRACFWPFGEA